MSISKSKIKIHVLLFPILVNSGCFDPAPQLPEPDGSSTTIDASTGGAEGTSVDVETQDTASDDSGTTCGNGIVEAGETCDDGGESAICDVDCTEVVCGDLNVNTAAGEECEGDNLGGETCRGMGFDGGTLSCGDGCSYDSSGCDHLPDAPVLELSFSQVKQFDFNWAAIDGADYYRLEQSVAPGEPFLELERVGAIMGESVSVEMPLHFRYEASYRLQACNLAGCTVSAVVDVVGSLAEAVGYFKASNTGASDLFGYSVALSGDGNTLESERAYRWSPRQANRCFRFPCPATP